MHESEIMGSEWRMGRINAGFSLLEVMVAIAIFTFGMLAIAHLHTTIARANADARHLKEATALARQMLDRMKSLEGFYKPAYGKCQASPIVLPNTAHTAISDALLDPEAVAAGEADPLCPARTQPDDLNPDEELDSSKTDGQVAEAADRCLKRDSLATSACAPVNDVMSFDGENPMYWIVWNLRASYPEDKMTTVRLYVFWRGMNGKRHWVKVNDVLTAKDMIFYGRGG